MARLSFELRELLDIAVDSARNPGQLLRELGVHELIDVIKDEQDCRVVAAEAFYFMCTDGDGEYNGQEKLFTTILAFVNNHAETPTDDPVGFAHAVWFVLTKGGCTRDALEDCISNWFS